MAVGAKDQCSNTSGNLSRSKSYAVKFDLNNLNTISWAKQFDTLSVYNGFCTINELKNGDLILSGGLDTLKNYGYTEKTMLRLIKLDKNGNLKWKKLFSRDSLTVNSKGVRSLNITADGSYLIANELFMATNPRPYSITKIDSTGCDSSAFYCSTVGIYQNSFLIQNINVYPNPASDLVSITYQGELTNLQLQVYNTIGQLICKEELVFTNNTATINTQKFANGVYVLTLSIPTQSEKRLYSKRLVIAR